MSNRRHPRPSRRPRALNGTTPPVVAPPPPLDTVAWTDEPPATYSLTTLHWIASKVPEIGMMNVWECEACGVGVLCYDRHPGVTPFMVSHHTLGNRDCNGMCQSTFYNGPRAQVARDAGPPTHEWYRPSMLELLDAPTGVKSHVLQGGLLVREAPA